jgi:hypothetical protein
MEMTRDLITRSAAEAGSQARAQMWIAAQSGDQLDMLRRMKFEPIGFHPLEDRPPNLIEQINQTWTFAVAIAAARQLLELHADVSGHASRIPGSRHYERRGWLCWRRNICRCEPRNNGKLAADLAKLSVRRERHRYVFFMSPLFPGNERRPQFERDGVEVWSVDV